MHMNSNTSGMVLFVSSQIVYYLLNNLIEKVEFLRTNLFVDYKQSF